MSHPVLTLEEARRLRDARWVDLRSPSEFARDAIPGAVNVPLFDDDERALIGTLYKQVSPDAAVAEGQRLVNARLPRLIAAVRGDGAEPLVLYCWRGGMRSRAVAELLHGMGVAVAQLQGGYKAYRSWVLARLAAWPPAGPSPFVLISGATGTGKTLLLEEIEAEAPGTTLDLEACAGHRSSILGAVGRRPVSQAAFEGSIVARTGELGPPPWFVEAESRKVGDAVIPEPLWRAMRSGFVAELRATAATRVRVLVDDYLSSPSAASEIAERLPFLEGRLGREWTGRLTALNAAGRHEEVAALLLEHYYDPLYRHSGRDLHPGMHVDREDPARVERLLALRASRVELPPRPCADSSASQVFPAARSLPSSTKA